MGLLATAGMVSGMGQGLERGLAQFQQGVTQMGLQEDRFNREAVVRKDEHSFQSEKLQEQLRHAEALQRDNQTFHSGETNKTIASHEKIASDQIDQRNQESTDRNAEDNLKRHDKRNVDEETLKQSRDKIDNDKQWHKDYVGALKDRATAIGAKAHDPMKDLPASTQRAYAAEMRKAEARYKAAVSALDDDTRVKLMEEGDGFADAAEALLPNAKAKPAPAGVQLEGGDPFGSSPLLGGGKMAPGAGALAPKESRGANAAPAASAKPKPTNVVAEGKAKLEQVKMALDEAKKTKNDALIAPLQKQYDELRARWGTAGLIDEAGGN